MTFLDTMLHLMILGEMGRNLRLPTRVRSVCIDPKLHLEFVRKYTEETEGKEHFSIYFLCFAIYVAPLEKPTC